MSVTINNQSVQASTFMTASRGVLDFRLYAHDAVDRATTGIDRILRSTHPITKEKIDICVMPNVTLLLASDQDGVDLGLDFPIALWIEESYLMFFDILNGLAHRGFDLGLPALDTDATSHKKLLHAKGRNWLSIIGKFEKGIKKGWFGMIEIEDFDPVGKGAPVQVSQLVAKDMTGVDGDDFVRVSCNVFLQGDAVPEPPVAEEAVDTEEESPESDADESTDASADESADTTE